MEIIFPEDSVLENENKQNENSKVKIIGCGGSGSNTISKVFKSNLDNVETCIINSDSGSLRYSFAHNRILIGKGFGCGGDVDKARQIINKDIDKIKNIVKDSKAIILTTGMGGGTGSACVCEIAKVAKELNIPTIAVVTQPFKVEENPRIDTAIQTIEELKKYTNFVFVIENDNLFPLISSKINYSKLYDYIDDILKIIIEEINDVINYSGDGINLDLEDLKSIGKENFVNLRLGIGQTLKEAFDNALSHKMFEDIDKAKVKNVLINVSYGNNSQYTISAAKDLYDIVNKIFINRKYLKIGNTINSNLNNQFKIILLIS